MSTMKNQEIECMAAEFLDFIEKYRRIFPDLSDEKFMLFFKLAMLGLRVKNDIIRN